MRGEITVLIALLIDLGHEAVGIVAKCGSDAECEGLKVGDRVTVENHFYCGECYTCKVRIL